MKKISYIKNSEPMQRRRVNIKRIAFSVVLGVLLAIILLIVSACVLSYTNLKIDFVKTLASMALYLGALASGFLSGVNTKNNGWLAGLISGASYYALIMCIGLLFTHNLNILTLLFKLIFIMLFSALGGIVGVNMNFKKRKR